MHQLSLSKIGRLNDRFLFQYMDRLIYSSTQRHEEASDRLGRFNRLVDLLNKRSHLPDRYKAATTLSPLKNDPHSITFHPTNPEMYSPLTLLLCHLSAHALSLPATSP